MTESAENISLIEGIPDSIPGICRYSHQAMAAAFEIFILHADAAYAEQVAWSAFDEVDRLEQERQKPTAQRVG